MRTLVLDGWIVHRRDPSLSLLFAQEAEKDTLHVDNPFLIDSVYRLMAFSYGDLNNRSATLTSHLNRLKVLGKLDSSTKALASANYETAGLIANQGDKALAVPYFEECLRISKSIGYRTQEGQALIELSSILHQNGETEQAIEYLVTAWKIFKEMERLQFMVGYIEVRLAIIYLEEGDEALAWKQANSALKHVDLSKFVEYSGLIYSNAGKVAVALNHQREAISWNKSALNIFEENNKMFYLPAVYLQLSQAYEGIQSDSALFFMKQYVAINDSVINIENNRKIAELQLQFGDEQKQQQIQLLKQQQQIAVQEQALAEADSARKSYFITIFGIGLGVMALIAVGLFYVLRLVRKQKQQVLVQKTEVEEQKKEMEDSIIYAKRIQDAILPERQKLSAIFPESFVLYRPKDNLSGDFYWCAEVTTKHEQQLRLFAVGDCTGHGVPGALLSILGVNYLNLGSVSSNINSPGQALDYLDNGVQHTFESTSEIIRDGMDIVLGAIDSSTMMLHYAGAKNPLYVVRAGELHVLKSDKQAIGKDAYGKVPFSDYSFQLEKGDVLYACSDGYQDQFGGHANGGKKYKLGRFKQLLVQVSENDMQRQRTMLNEELEQWMGEMEQVDDIAIMGIRI